MKPLSLLVASDGSDGALHAAEWLTSHFDAETVTITVVTVSRSPVDMGSPTFSTVPAYSKPLTEAAEQEAVEANRKTAQILKSFHPSTRVIVGPTIGDALAAFSLKHHIDAIVVGRRNHSLARHVLGSPFRSG